MQLRFYKASARGTNMALSRPVLGLCPLASLHHWTALAAQEGHSELSVTGQQVLPYMETQPLGLLHCGMVLLVLALSVPQCVGRASQGQRPGFQQPAHCLAQGNDK